MDSISIDRQLVNFYLDLYNSNKLNLDENLLFDSSISNNYYGWQITDNGKHLYNNAIEGQQTLIYNFETNELSELSHPKDMNTGYQYVIFTPKHIIYNDNDYIIIEDYENKIIKMINNNNLYITNLVKNDKYLFISDDDNNIKGYDLDTYELIFTFHKSNIRYMNISRNNKYLITGNSAINIYDLEKNNLIKTVRQNQKVREIAISQKHIALVLSRTNRITIYNLDGTKLYNIYKYDKYENYDYLNYSYDEKYLYYGNSYELIIFEVNNDTINYKFIKKYKFQNITSYCLTNDDYKILYINDKEMNYIYTPQFYHFIYNLLINFLPYELIRHINSYL